MMRAAESAGHHGKAANRETPTLNRKVFDSLNFPGIN